MRKFRIETSACSCDTNGGSNPDPPTFDPARARERGVDEFELEGRRGLDGVDVDDGGCDMVGGSRRLKGEVGVGEVVGQQAATAGPRRVRRQTRPPRQPALPDTSWLPTPTNLQSQDHIPLSPSSPMPKDPEPSLVQREFTLAAIAAGIRTDGRKLTEARPWQLEWVGGEEGGVECRLGDTWSVSRLLVLGYAPLYNVGAGDRGSRLQPGWRHELTSPLLPGSLRVRCPVCLCVCRARSSSLVRIDRTRD